MMVLYAIAPIGQAAHIERASLALEETLQRTLVVFGQPPIATEIVAGATRHEANADTGSLLGGKRGTHNAVHRFGERAIASQDQNLIASPLNQLAS